MLTNQQQDAVGRLHEILVELDELGNEAADLMRQHFPELYRSGDAYGAFTLGSSSNRYDTTLESLVGEAENYEDEEDLIDEV